MENATFDDEFVSGLFAGLNFGDHIQKSVVEQRKQIAKTLKNQLDGYWSGHSAYHMVVDAGFLQDAKSGDKKVLTPLGQAYMDDFNANIVKYEALS